MYKIKIFIVKIKEIFKIDKIILIHLNSNINKYKQILKNKINKMHGSAFRKINWMFKIYHRKTLLVQN